MLIDISVPLRLDMPVWPGEAGFALERTRSLDRGDPVTSSLLRCSVLVGTHVDAPCHFVLGGAGVESLPLDVLIGDAVVIDIGAAPAVTARTLDAAAVPAATRRLLIRSTNSALWQRPGAPFVPDYVGLAPDAAHWLVARQVALVGVDYLSVQRFADDPETHRVLLGAGVVVLEGLDLSAAPAGAYELYCLPIKLAGADGAPARAVLRPRR
ncbi:MAG: cyclase family protein [Candidatus Schekmanbacteria bacterium]|nr:cyclase family protein [Candidatus Schekmanbacteria bacterium]